MKINFTKRNRFSIGNFIDSVNLTQQLNCEHIKYYLFQCVWNSKIDSNCFIRRFFIPKKLNVSIFLLCSSTFFIKFWTWFVQRIVYFSFHQKKDNCIVRAQTTKTYMFSEMFDKLITCFLYVSLNILIEQISLWYVSNCFHCEFGCYLSYSVKLEAACVCVCFPQDVKFIGT